MGEDAKKVKEKKKEEEHKDETQKPALAVDEKKPEAEQPPPPPQEIVLRVHMHCEGCARKVRKCLKGFDGVEDVITDYKTGKVVVKGEKADPIKVLERVQKKSHRKVELISPIPKPPAEEPNKPEVKEVVLKPTEKTEEQICNFFYFSRHPPVITVVFGISIHCEACAQEIKKRIMRIKGVESAELNLKSSQVTVKGAFEPEKLTEYVHKKTRKHVVILKAEPEKKEEKVKEENKAEGAPAGDKKGGEPPVKPETETKTEDAIVELKRNEMYYYYHPQNYQVEPQRFVKDNYEYPPQMFSDENPNSCSIM